MSERGGAAFADHALMGELVACIDSGEERRRKGNKEGDVEAGHCVPCQREVECCVDVV